MRIGAVFPHTEIGDDPGVVRAWAQSVEEFGYHHVLAFDHVLGVGAGTRPGWQGYTNDAAFHEPLVLFGFLAGVTTTLELTTGVLVLPQRQTALVAKQAAQVHLLSGGRLRLGVGIGWNEVEYEALGQTFGNRGVRSEEQVALMRALWAQSTVDFEGRWHRVDGAGINPRPGPGAIPVWFGGYSERTLRRVGRLGDGWMPRRWPDETAHDMLERVRAYAREAGRDPATIGFETRLTLAQVPEGNRAEFVRGWRDIGATHLCVDTMSMGLSSPEQHLEVLRDTLKLIESALT
ncbi:LLM class F420-dependent oxidoreductase [Saccharothrix sp. ALI-22-I]|uniref:LLM class F420-dependent oxidoreductase n=1 Tax=Saccharothrix sp. ALI-22-I TaxID=1933778 RepID=UPI00097BED64|nr:LLM class F420-dependent oxidoreductase [Saccharothrix sp. ALI-22-I]ONI84650.1 LLM class F420-dependent oxidoreductase [Saccharothrix sp. ALI-22-I]